MVNWKQISYQLEKVIQKFKKSPSFLIKIKKNLDPFSEKIIQDNL